jgi:hypothetical protein
MDKGSRDGAHAFYTMYMSCAELSVNRPHNRSNVLSYFKSLVQLENMLSPFTDEREGYEDSYRKIYDKFSKIDEASPNYVNESYQICGEFLGLLSQAMQELGLLIPVNSTSSDGVLAETYSD